MEYAAAKNTLCRQCGKHFLVATESSVTAKPAALDDEFLMLVLPQLDAAHPATTRALAAGNSLSLLHVTRPEIDLPLRETPRPHRGYQDRHDPADEQQIYSEAEDEALVALTANKCVDGAG